MYRIPAVTDNSATFFFEIQQFPEFGNENPAKAHENTIKKSGQNNHIQYSYVANWQ